MRRHMTCCGVAATGLLLVTTLASCKGRSEPIAGSGGPLLPPALPSKPVNRAPAVNPDQASENQLQRASARLVSRQGVEGSVALVQKGKELRITVQARGLRPGQYGMHIHEKGDCKAQDFSSAGAHFDPKGHPHGGPDDAKRHAGDLGNLVVKPGEQLTVRSVTTKGELSLASGTPSSVIGRALIIHSKRDDLKSQPAGDAGGRLACGVIERGDPRPRPALGPAGEAAGQGGA